MLYKQVVQCKAPYCGVRFVNRSRYVIDFSVCPNCGGPVESCRSKHYMSEDINFDKNDL